MTKIQLYLLALRSSLITSLALIATVGCGSPVSSATDARQSDGGVLPSDGGSVDADVVVCNPVDLAAPARILFIGNSFTLGDDVTGQFREVAMSAGEPEPTIGLAATGGQTLQGHRADARPEGAPARVAEGWDVVILQEYSTRPTDAVGPAQRFKEDAAWFTDRAREANPDVRVVLYETWARHPDHSVYPTTFADAAEMQAQLRFHYNDAATSYIPANATVTGSAIEVARAGDAWEQQLAGQDPVRLHGGDNYHQNAAGAHMNALALFSTVYHRRVSGLSRAHAAANVIPRLEQAVNTISGEVVAPPAIDCPVVLAGDDELRVDFGSIIAVGWSSHDAIRGISAVLTTASGAASNASVTTFGFAGTQTGGPAETEASLGLPAEASQDSIYIGNGAPHADALGKVAEVELRGVAPGRYRMTLFAGRDGDDDGLGRLTRYTVGEVNDDLDASNNTTQVAVLEDLRPDDDGRLLLKIGVSPDGMARYAYIGTLTLARIGD